MAKNNLWLKITTPEHRIEKMIIEQLAQRLRSSINKVAQVGPSQLRPIVENAILGCPEMQSLAGGKLAGQLGLYPSQQSSAPLQIAAAVSDNVELEPQVEN